MKTNLQLMQESPFFETFQLEHLERLAAHACITRVEKGETIVKENDAAEALHMLIIGQVQLLFEVFPDASNPRDPEAEQILVRTISDPGRIIGWSAMVEPYHYRATAVALDETQLLTFEREWLEQYCDEHPEFGVALMQRILWVLGNRLRETRIRLVARRYEQETLAIRALLDQNVEELHVTSPLQKIPFYLENRLTLSDAFQTLELLKVHGDELERDLAGMCLEILENVHRELLIYQGLQNVYEHVSSAPATANPEDVRRACSLGFSKVFEHTSYFIEGEDNLPDEPGHIYIMNHLDNHPDNTLIGDFRLTLDTHFVSSMLLYKKYGEPPIRVIRKSKPDEYAHQKYYDRLGYIYVYAGHIDEDVDDPEALMEQRKRYFLDTANHCLREGKNVMICPEGACTTTENSPLPFKAGAFRLAAYADPEPYIVPIAVAYFDRKITRANLVAVVEQPFKLSDHFPDGFEDQQLFDFVNHYHDEFRSYVQKAMALAEAAEAAATR